MKKRISALLLAACLLLSTAALAASDSTENFIRSKTYSGEFSDLTADSVFYDNVSALFEYGLSIGKTDGTYGLSDNLTVGQAIIFAARIRSLYRTGDPEAGAAAQTTDSPLTAMSYLLYLQQEGVLGSELDAHLTEVATRAQMAHILANLLPEDVLPSINHDVVTQCYASRRFISDVTEYTPYYYDILKLYRQGISQGSDYFGSFLPDAPITRGAAAAMLTRLIDPALRITLTWDLSTVTSAKGTTLADLVPEGTYVASPVSNEDLYSSICHMLSSNSNQLTLHFDDMSAAWARDVMHAALLIVKSDFCEQGYNSVFCAYSDAGDITLTFSATIGDENLQEYRAAAMEAAIAVHDQLWTNGTLNADMTQTEIARAYYTWICENCVYDDHAADDSPSHLPYGLFLNGTAVCDGYTSAYNMLLKLEGIPCSTYFTSDHIWTVADLDGVRCHIDTTWGDSGTDISYLFFAMTPELSATYHWA